MMVVLKKTLSVSEKNVHIRFPFVLDRDMEKMEIFFSYRPQYGEIDEPSLQAVRAGFERYEPDSVYTDEELKKYLPLRNAMTISLDSPSGVYVGGIHRPNNIQHHVISEKEASRGFVPVKIEKGEWVFTISVFNVPKDGIPAEIEVICE